MPAQQQLDDVYMYTARLHANLSKAIRKQVGACMVTASGIIIPGYNGTPAGMPNACEDNLYQPIMQKWSLVTKPEVLHAELNCILKAAREGYSILDSTVYVTLSPCIQCSAMMIQAGIKRLVYAEEYRDNKGLTLLEDEGIIVEKYKERT